MNRRYICVKSPFILNAAAAIETDSTLQPISYMYACCTEQSHIESSPKRTSAKHRVPALLSSPTFPGPRPLAFDMFQLQSSNSSGHVRIRTLLIAISYQLSAISYHKGLLHRRSTPRCHPVSCYSPRSRCALQPERSGQHQHRCRPWRSRYGSSPRLSFRAHPQSSRPASYAS